MKDSFYFELNFERILMFKKTALKIVDRDFLWHRFIWVALSLLFVFLCQMGYSEDTIKIKILAVNPSSTHNLKTTVAQYLPPEVHPDDVLDKEDIQIKYDTEKRSYFIQKEVDLKPSEAQTIEVRVRNVWFITPEEIEEVKSQLKQSTDALSKTKFATTGKLLFERASESIDRIEESQTKTLGINQRVELYRMNIKQLEDLKQNAISLESMRQLEEEKKLGVRQAKFIVSAENPSQEERKLTVRSELPRDIKAEDVLEKGDFTLVFDDKKLTFSLEREDTLGPRESRKYEIAIRDVWHIAQSELDFLKSEIEKIVPLFIKSPYEDFALKQKEIVLKSIQAIVALQAEVESSANLDDRIRAHVLNEQREKLAKRKIKELQDLLSEVSLSTTEIGDKTPLQQMIKKILNLKDKILTSLGIQPQKTIFWWFFLGIVLFLAVVTIIFYGTWLKKLQDNKWSPPQKTSPKTDAKDESTPEPKP